MYDYLIPKQLDEIQDKVRLIDRYDLMKMYRSRVCEEEKQAVFGDVQLQHQDLIRFHEQRRRELIERIHPGKALEKTRFSG
ncbi:unnamed protein product [Echinostoma caproni]|uniref:Transcriptional regulator n=1 Tax=Echinostoma caproni TaxID=27848 RepID=A0A183ALJ7_9TREM|nr:unnamed protein product [Echinostoma caproni]